MTVFLMLPSTRHLLVWCGTVPLKRLYCVNKEVTEYELLTKLVEYNNSFSCEEFTGNVSTIAGTGSRGMKNGHVNEAMFCCPSGIAVDGASGDIYVADTGNHVIRKITNDGILRREHSLIFSGMVSTFSGSGVRGQKDGISAETKYACPRGIAINSLGGILYVCDDHRVVQVELVSGSFIRNVNSHSAREINHNCGLCYCRMHRQGWI